MNNKIKVSTFFKAGGVCVIELWPDLPHVLGKPWIYYADSIERIAEIKKEIEDICYTARGKFCTNIYWKQLVSAVNFKLDRCFYEAYDPFYLEEDEYLRVKYKFGYGKSNQER